MKLLQHASAFERPQGSVFTAAATASELALPQLFRDRAMSLLLSSTLSGADNGCARLILASAAVGSGDLDAALLHLAHAHQLDMTEACALSNRSIVLQLKGNHAEAFEAVKQAISLRFELLSSSCALSHPTSASQHAPHPRSPPQPLRPAALQQPVRPLPQHEKIRRLSQGRSAVLGRAAELRTRSEQPRAAAVHAGAADGCGRQPRCRCGSRRRADVRADQCCQFAGASLVERCFLSSGCCGWA